MVNMAISCGHRENFFAQRNNGRGGFSGSGLNITIRVLYRHLDASQDPGWYPSFTGNAYISECYQFAPTVFMQ
jgi:hypothetical protein